MNRDVATRRCFDFTAHMEDLCRVICGTSPQMSHIDCDHVAFSFAQTRKRGPYGMWASLTPLRFQNGALVERRHGQDYSVQRLYDEQGREMLYILAFYLPRFLELSYDEKLDTVFHELWHVSPQFDGDIRRFTGRCFAHSHSQAEYDRQVSHLVATWLADHGHPPEADFLRYSFAELRETHGTIVGRRVTQPKLIPLS